MDEVRVETACVLDEVKRIQTWDFSLTAAIANSALQSAVPKCVEYSVLVSGFEYQRRRRNSWYPTKF